MLLLDMPISEREEVGAVMLDHVVLAILRALEIQESDGVGLDRALRDALQDEVREIHRHADPAAYARWMRKRGMSE